MVVSQPPESFSPHNRTDLLNLLSPNGQVPTRPLMNLLAQNRRDHPDWPDELLLPHVEVKKQRSCDCRYDGEKDECLGSLRLTSIENVKHPVLLVVGNAELGGIVTAEVVAKVKQLNPQVNITVIPDVGHLIRFDKPGEFMNTLRSFLKRLS
ncbi:MAG: alpha/beta hydrolase [Anaerolineae bacterium]